MRIETAFRRLGWSIAESDDIGGQEPIFLAEADRGSSRFRLIVHCLPDPEPWLLYRRRVKRITRPEPLAGIIPRDLSSCNLPSRTLTFIRTSERSCFQYAEEALGTESGRDLMPDLLPIVHRLRRRFLDEYLAALAAETTDDDLFYLNLLVTENPLSILHPQEVEEALAGDNPAALGWEAGFVPLHLPPSTRARLGFLLGQMPALYWLISTRALEESLQFILSYAPRWQVSARA